MADPKHDVAGVVAPLGFSPQVELFGEVGGGLPGQRRIGRADALPLLAVASGTGGQTTRGIPLVIERQAPGLGGGARERQPGVMEGYGLALTGIELLRDPAHLPMGSATVGIRFQLPFQISRIEPRQTWRTSAISPPVEPVTGEARVARPRLPAAERDQSSVRREPIERNGLRVRTAGQQRRAGKNKMMAHGGATDCNVGWFQALRLVPLLLLTAACKPPPEQSQFMPVADVAHGREVIERAGCGACHTIKGINWPQGKVGPSLDGLANRALIAGQLPNRPDVLASYIRNAPALVPGSGMPAMPVTETEARDVAAYLYQQGDR